VRRKPHPQFSEEKRGETGGFWAFALAQPVKKGLSSDEKR